MPIYVDIPTCSFTQQSVLVASNGTIPSVFNFYIYLRTHPLLLRHKLVSAVTDGGATLPPSLLSQTASARTASASDVEMTAAERSLFFRTAHDHSNAGCPALALEVLSKLPSVSLSCLRVSVAAAWPILPCQLWPFVAWLFYWTRVADAKPSEVNTINSLVLLSCSQSTWGQRVLTYSLYTSQSNSESVTPENWPTQNVSSSIGITLTPEFHCQVKF